MTRYFYFQHSDKEFPITKNYGLNKKVYVLDTARHLPKEIKFIDTKEDDLLFETKEACETYYK